MTSQTDVVKKNAVAFYNLMFNQCRPREAIEQFAGDSYAQGDLGVLHCHQKWPGDHDYAGMDIFRFDTNDKIVEHWDVLQIVPDKAAHDNGMF